MTDAEGRIETYVDDPAFAVLAVNEREAQTIVSTVVWLFVALGLRRALAERLHLGPGSLARRGRGPARCSTNRIGHPLKTYKLQAGHCQSVITITDAPSNEYSMQIRIPSYF